MEPRNMVSSRRPHDSGGTQLSNSNRFLKRTIGYLMSAPDRVSIPIHASPGDAPNSEPNPPRQRILRRIFNRRTTSAAFMVMLALAGWGAYQYFESTKAEIDQDLISDFEAFDSAPSFSEVPKTGDQETVGQQVIDLPPTLSSSSVAGSTNESGVWLTGTIEETEPTNHGSPSIRISGGPAEASSFR